MRPDIQLTLLDSLNKRLIFLQEVCDNIGIDAEIIHKRAEEGGRDKNLREKYDIEIAFIANAFRQGKRKNGCYERQKRC